MTDKEKLTNQQKIDSLMTSSEEISEKIATLNQTVSSLSSGSLSDEMKTAIKEAVSEALKEEKVALGQDHKHGMSDPQCTGCNVVVQESLDTAKQKGIAERDAYWEAIPGVTKLREIRENQASDKAPDQEMITVTG